MEVVRPGPRVSQSSYLLEHSGAGENKKEHPGEYFNWMSVVLSSIKMRSQLSALTSLQNPTASLGPTCCKH